MNIYQHSPSYIDSQLLLTKIKKRVLFSSCDQMASYGHVTSLSSVTPIFLGCEKPVMTKWHFNVIEGAEVTK